MGTIQTGQSSDVVVCVSVPKGNLANTHPNSAQHTNRNCNYSSNWIDTSFGDYIIFVSYKYLSISGC